MSDAAADLWGLPNPEYHPDFYLDVPVKRLVAFMIDSLLIGLISVLLIPLTAFTALFWFPALMVIVSFVYRTLTLAAGSATPGMRLVAIEMRNHRGERFDLATAAAHTLLFSMMISMVLPQLISAALILTTARKQGLHDLALGTAAVNRSARS